MPDNQNPVFTDNSTVLGDGTKQNPLHAAAAPAGVTSLNGETGDIDIVAGSGISVTPAGQNITIAATGGGVTAVTGTASEITSSGGTTPQIALANPCTAPGDLNSVGELVSQRSVTVASGFFLKFTNAFLNDAGPNGILSPRTTGGALGSMRLSLPIFANNAAALGGGLVAGDLYRTGADPDPVCIVH